MRMISRRCEWETGPRSISMLIRDGTSSEWLIELLVEHPCKTKELTNFEVRIQILRPEVLIRPGMSARVDIQTEKADQALSVPIQSVTVRIVNTDHPSEQLTHDQPDKGDAASPITEDKHSVRIVF